MQLGSTDLVTFALDALLEGCIGEGAAALEAADEALGEVDPEIRSVLERIAEDEQRHAELGWRCVQWALARDRRGVGDVLRATLATWAPRGDLRDDIWRTIARPVLERMVSTSDVIEELELGQTAASGA